MLTESHFKHNFDSLILFCLFHFSLLSWIFALKNLGIIVLGYITFLNNCKKCLLAADCNQ